MAMILVVFGSNIIQAKALGPTMKRHLKHYIVLNLIGKMWPVFLPIPCII
ncbi:hypothetical protein ES703_54234 [subsurface metagenome]